jgi:hypothetical protein
MGLSSGSSSMTTGNTSRPHLHAEYQDDVIIIAIETGDILEGRIPPAKLKLVLAWVEIHREELMADWKLAVEGKSIFKIEGLK